MTVPNILQPLVWISCLWGPPVCVLVHQAPRWVTGTSGGHGDACGGSHGGQGRSGPCPWSYDGDGGDDGDDGPWSGRGPVRAPWAEGRLTAWWCWGLCPGLARRCLSLRLELQDHSLPCQDFSHPRWGHTKYCCGHKTYVVKASKK